MGLQDNLSRDAVEALEQRKAVVVGGTDTVRGALSLMRAQRDGCVVVTEHGKATGIFTERDFLTKVLARGRSLDTPIRDVMSFPAVVIERGCSVADVIRTMHARGFRHMPVVSADGRLDGVVSVKRIVEYITEHFPEAVFNLPPEPVQQQVAREGA